MDYIQNKRSLHNIHVRIAFAEGQREKHSTKKIGKIQLSNLESYSLSLIQFVLFSKSK